MFILTVSAKPSAVVATPTTMAVSIRTCGRGLEYISFTLSVKIGAVPPAIFPKVIYKRNTDVWKIARPTIFFKRLFLEMKFNLKKLILQVISLIHSLVEKIILKRIILVI